MSGQPLENTGRKPDAPRPDNPAILYRQATDADLDAIAAMELVCFPEEPWSRDMVAAEFSGINPSRYYVAVDGGQICGYAGIWLIPPEGYITNVAVHPDRRRLGIGGKLLEKLMAGGLAEGVSEFTLEVRVSNDPAIALYRAYGFEEAGVRKRYYQDGEDALIMWAHAASEESPHPADTERL